MNAQLLKQTTNTGQKTYIDLTPWGHIPIRLTAGAIGSVQWCTRQHTYKLDLRTLAVTRVC